MGITGIFPAAITIAAMEETNGQPTPQLLTEIQFKVTRKGYDPTEVDGFLERLSVAVGQMQEKLRQSAAATAAAESRAADAVRANAVLQTRISELESTAPSPAAAQSLTPEAEAEQAASVLAMAQRTADAVVNEARENAARLVSDAETEASNLLSDAQRRAEVSIGQLDERRREIAADRDALEAFMDEQRAALGADVARITAVLDDPRALRVAPLPVDLGDADDSEVDETPVEAVPSSDLPTMATPVVEVAESDEESGSEGRAGIFDAEAETAQDGQLFGDSDDDADEAMRRFFDADFDDDRFGR